MNPEKIFLIFVAVGIWIATGWIAERVVKAGLSKIKSDNVREFIRRDIISYFAPVIAIERCAKKGSWNYVHQMRVIYRYTFRGFGS